MIYKLSELFDLQMGKTPSRNNASYWNSKENKWISIGDLSKCDIYISDTKEYISNLAVLESGIKLIPKNTVIMSFKLSIGKAAITAEDMYSNEAIMAFLDKNIAPILPEYLCYMFNYMNWEVGTNKAVLGKTLNKATLSEIKIKIHGLNEQKIIIKKLNKLKQTISARNKQLKLYDKLVKSLFVEMFGDPVISSNGKKQVPFSEFIAYIRYGTSQPPVFSTNGEFKFIRATNIKKGKIIPKDMLRIDAIEANKIKKCQLTGNEIIIVRSGVNAGDTGIITSQYIGDYAGYDIIVSIDLKKGNPVYFNELINTHYMEQIIKPLTIRSAQPHLNAQQVKELPMVLATLEEQNNFAEVIEQIDKHKSVVQKSLDETQILFDSLMQKYFG